MTLNLFLLGYLVLFFGAIAFMLWSKRRARQDRAPFPENTRLLRGPGESLRRKTLALDEQIDNALLVGFFVPLGGLFLLGFLALQLTGWPRFIVSVLSLVAFVALLLVMGRRVVGIIDRKRNTALGCFGELIVGEHLEPLKAAGYRIYHDLPAGDPPAGSATPPFNIDHVVIGPAGVFAIETKTRRKGRARVGFMAHEIIYDGRALSYPWGEDRHGLDQAARQAQWLAAHLEKQLGQPIPVHPLLVFPGWMIIRKAVGSVNVLNPRELPSAIHGASARSASYSPSATLDAETIDLVARQLEGRCRDVEL